MSTWGATGGCWPQARGSTPNAAIVAAPAPRVLKSSRRELIADLLSSRELSDERARSSASQISKSRPEHRPLRPSGPPPKRSVVLRSCGVPGNAAFATASPAQASGAPVVTELNAPSGPPLTFQPRGFVSRRRAACRGALRVMGRRCAGEMAVAGSGPVPRSARKRRMAHYTSM